MFRSIIALFMLLSGCAHDRAQSLVARYSAGVELHEIRVGDQIQLTLTKDQVIQGYYAGKEVVPLKSVAGDRAGPTQFERVIKITDRDPTGVLDQEERFVAGSRIKSLAFTRPPTTWIIFHWGLIGAVPGTIIGYQLSKITPGQTTLDAVAFSLVLGGIFGAMTSVPGVFLSGLFNQKSAQFDDVGSTWLLE